MIYIHNIGYYVIRIVLKDLIRTQIICTQKNNFHCGTLLAYDVHQHVYI